MIVENVFVDLDLLDPNYRFHAFPSRKKRTFDNYSTDFYTKLYLLRYTSSEIIQIKSPLLLKYMIDEYGEIFLDNVVK